ncbi:hypothetical protein [Streptomyces sp. 351MFTsu5.1]|uniref:hypothetical protein n=1 Tax=Streptomyces sp. 351MFTsu5.1 TaxID=1172180 RepID=UPI00036B40B7|nr:hypothetical protein [Streptomyces sp. 351MFTsu5.1]
MSASAYGPSDLRRSAVERTAHRAGLPEEDVTGDRPSAEPGAALARRGRRPRSTGARLLACEPAFAAAVEKLAPVHAAERGIDGRVTLRCPDLHVVRIAGHHLSPLDPPHAQTVAAHWNRALGQEPVGAAASVLVSS